MRRRCEGSGRTCPSATADERELIRTARTWWETAAIGIDLEWNGAAQAHGCARAATDASSCSHSWAEEGSSARARSPRRHRREAGSAPRVARPRRAERSDMQRAAGSASGDDGSSPRPGLTGPADAGTRRKIIGIARAIAAARRHRPISREVGRAIPAPARRARSSRGGAKALQDPTTRGGRTPTRPPTHRPPAPPPARAVIVSSHARSRLRSGPGIVPGSPESGRGGGNGSRRVSACD